MGKDSGSRATSTWLLLNRGVNKSFTTKLSLYSPPSPPDAHSCRALRASSTSPLLPESVQKGRMLSVRLALHPLRASCGAQNRSSRQLTAACRCRVGLQDRKRFQPPATATSQQPAASSQATASTKPTSRAGGGPYAGLSLSFTYFSPRPSHRCAMETTSTAY